MPPFFQLNSVSGADMAEAPATSEAAMSPASADASAPSCEATEMDPWDIG